MVQKLIQDVKEAWNQLGGPQDRGCVLKGRKVLEGSVGGIEDEMDGVSFLLVGKKPK